VVAQADRVVLRKCAEAMSEDLGAEPCERFDGGDQIFWDFLLGDLQITLHWKQTDGVFVVSREDSPRSRETVRRVAEHLERRLQVAPTSSGDSSGG